MKNELMNLSIKGLLDTKNTVMIGLASTIIVGAVGFTALRNKKKEKKEDVEVVEKPAEQLTQAVQQAQQNQQQLNNQAPVPQPMFYDQYGNPVNIQVMPQQTPVVTQ